MIHKVTIKYANHDDVLTFTNDYPRIDTEEDFIKIYHNGELKKLINKDAFSDLDVTSEADVGPVAGFEVVKETSDKVS